MEIILLRHGRPAFSLEQKVAARELPQVIADYNRAGVRESALAFACDIASSCEFVVCSDLPRSIQPAAIAGSGHDPSSSAVVARV